MYGLIGERLPHSYSKIIHELNGLKYSLIEIEKERLESFIKEKKFLGLNVTIPYKKEVIKYLDFVSKEAQEINAVNTIKNVDGKLYGYNTDVFGMKFMFDFVGVSVKDKNVLILGSGGTCNTAKYLLKKEGAKSVNVVSRSGQINYENCYQLFDTEVIINTTPVGTYPNVTQKPIELSRFNNLKAVFDCVYNPINTELILQAKNLNIPCSSGLPMLVYQAIKAQEIWKDTKFDIKVVENVLRKLKENCFNLALVGMPSCGKTTIGKALAKMLNKEFIDTDLEIEKRYGAPKDIIESKGEEFFRDIEEKIVCECANSSGKIISLGGGAILRENSIKALNRNSKICFIERDLDKLTAKDRPLSKSVGIEKLYQQRLPIYKRVSQFSVKNDTIDKAVGEIYEKFKNSCN